MKTTVLVSSVLAASFLFACGEKEPAAAGSGSAKASDAKSSAPAKSAAPAADAKPKVASCNVIKTESLCREYGSKNIEAAGEDFIKGLCTGGEFKMEACPADKRVGSCATPEGTKVFYTEGAFPMDAAKAEKSCKEGVPAGEWKAGG